MTPRRSHPDHTLDDHSHPDRSLDNARPPPLDESFDSYAPVVSFFFVSSRTASARSRSQPRMLRLQVSSPLDKGRDWAMRPSQTLPSPHRSTSAAVGGAAAETQRPSAGSVRTRLLVETALVRCGVRGSLGGRDPLASAEMSVLQTIRGCRRCSRHRCGKESHKSHKSHKRLAEGKTHLLLEGGADL